MNDKNTSILKLIAVLELVLVVIEILNQRKLTARLNQLLETGSTGAPDAYAPIVSAAVAADGSGLQTPEQWAYYYSQQYPGVVLPPSEEYGFSGDSKNERITFERWILAVRVAARPSGISLAPTMQAPLEPVYFTGTSTVTISARAGKKLRIYGVLLWNKTKQTVGVCFDGVEKHRFTDLPAAAGWLFPIAAQPWYDLTEGQSFSLTLSGSTEASGFVLCRYE